MMSWMKMGKIATAFRMEPVSKKLLLHENQHQLKHFRHSQK
jgi:hypothetical protein